MRHSNENAVRYGVVVVFAAVLLLGAGLGSVGREVAVAIPGLLGGLLVLVQPLLGLLAMVFLVPFENLTVELVGGGATATRFLGMAVAGAWLLRKLLRQEPWSHILGSRVLLAIVVFVMFAMLSSLWARIPFPLAAELMRFGMAAALTVLVIDLLRDWKDAQAMVAAMVLGGVVAALLVIQQYSTGSVRRAGDNIGGGINATAFVLVTLLPFGFYLVRAARPRLRVLGLSYVGLGVVAISMTLSRMSLMMVPLVLAVEAMESLRSRRSRAGLLALTAVVAVVGVRFVPQDRVVERVQTIGPYVQETLRGSGEGSTVSPRGFHIRIAFAIFRDHPILGAGHMAYRRLFIEEYQFEVPGSEILYRTPRSPHGSFWGFLADLGLVGLILWLVIVGAAARALISARARLPAPGKGGSFYDEGPRLLVRAIMVALAIQVIYMGYQDVEARKTFWAILGLAAAVERLASRSRNENGLCSPEPRPQGKVDPPLPQASTKTG